MTKSEIGKLGEDSVCDYLLGMGYRIVSRNYRIKGGEIDIIAENGDYIAFVEVKSRKPDSLVTGFEAVSKRKQGLIIKTAADYCLKHPNLLQPRFVVAPVIIDSNRVLTIDYVTNPSDTTGYNIIF